jgi:putative glutamine amidotransferase
MRKKIGISYTRTLFENYWNWITQGDMMDDLELVSLSFEKNNTEDIYKCHGFILTGGVDVHPDFYDGKTVYSNSPRLFQPERDEFEEKIYRYSQEKKLPLQYAGACNW